MNAFQLKFLENEMCSSAKNVFNYFENDGQFVRAIICWIMHAI